MPKKSHTKPAYIALGSNLGDRDTLIKQALKQLADTPCVSVIAVSKVIETTPLGKTDQPDFLNAAAKIETTISPDNLLKELQNIENSLGRYRKEKWSPRTIDLDLLLYADSIIKTPDLIVPHAQMHLRSFVLDPICQIAPDLIHPVLKHSMTQLRGRLNGANFTLDAQIPQIISIAGIIGVGKTTLAKSLTRQLSAILIQEAYDTNPYMARVYAGKKELALDSQLYFLKSRANQLARTKLSAGKVYITDYIFEKEIIYAELTLNPSQLAQYRTIHTSVAQTIAKPALVIYLNCSPNQALERIHKRNRPYEQQINLDTLKKLSDDYKRLFSDWRQCPVIQLEMDKFNSLDAENVTSLADEVKNYICT